MPNGKLKKTNGTDNIIKLNTTENIAMSFVLALKNKSAPKMDKTDPIQSPLIPSIRFIQLATVTIPKI